MLGKSPRAYRCCAQSLLDGRGTAATDLDLVEDPCRPMLIPHEPAVDPHRPHQSARLARPTMSEDDSAEEPSTRPARRPATRPPLWEGKADDPYNDRGERQWPARRYDAPPPARRHDARRQRHAAEEP